ncbi:MAG TPA: protein TolQ [Alphaproteobacteria bacterium]|nr:protein TolQ [Alphaproteobacteria bacterium]USO06252.1 MAG: protein TolQ [Rhodospirillales bacterium]HOO81456.1 protein TolQ [Alphaproteobacteria bacterium]
MPEAVPAAAVETVENLGSYSHDLSMFGLFMEADLIVKAVMMILMMASLWSWTIIFSKRSNLKRVNRKANIFEDSFWSGEPLDKIYQRVKNSKPDPILATFSAGMEEWQAGVAGGIPAKESLHTSLRQRVERAMNVAIGREINALERGMTFLASVGSTAPFIGLFGTVWGIMNSFSSIAATNNTSLAVVAPGIAEALFATALGLVAAIPAVVAYNVFSSGINSYADRLEAFTDEFMAILSRHLDSQDGEASGRRAAE